MANQPTVKTEEFEVHREHVSWLEECRGWRSEHRKALALLARVQATILEQEAALESHTAAIQAHEMHLQRYHLSQFAPDTADEAFLDEEHGEFTESHERARESHERLKKHHRDIVGEIEKLLKLCESPM